MARDEGRAHRLEELVGLVAERDAEGAGEAGPLTPARWLHLLPRRLFPFQRPLETCMKMWVRGPVPTRVWVCGVQHQAASIVRPTLPATDELAVARMGRGGGKGGGHTPPQRHCCPVASTRSACRSWRSWPDRWHTMPRPRCRACGAGSGREGGKRHEAVS